MAISIMGNNTHWIGNPGRIKSKWNIKFCVRGGKVLFHVELFLDGRVLVILDLSVRTSRRTCTDLTPLDYTCIVNGIS